VGGPILKDKLWYYMSVREQGSRRNILNVYYNTNAGDVAKWSYVPDFNKPAYYDRQWENYAPRITWQVSRKNKVSFSWDEQPVCRTCTGTASFSGSPSPTLTTPEADGHGGSRPRAGRRRSRTGCCSKPASATRTTSGATASSIRTRRGT